MGFSFAVISYTNDVQLYACKRKKSVKDLQTLQHRIQGKQTERGIL